MRVAKPRAIFIGSLLLIGIVAVLLHGPIPQDPRYHAFADQRRLLAIPRFADTISNLPFLGVGLAGLLRVRRRVPPGGLALLRSVYITFFAATVLISGGSAYYHLHPSNATLAWDRLPMTFAFMSLFTIMVGEYISAPLAVRLHVPLLLTGALSVLYWRLTDSGNGGDLRPYVLVQYLPMLLIPVMMLMYRSALEPTVYVWAVLACYALALGLELLDEPVFGATRTISGHTLKHLAAAVAVLFFLLALEHRRPRESGCIPSPTSRIA